MSDIGTKFADKRIRYVDSRISTEYRQAEKELNETLADFVRKSAERDKIKRKQRDEGIISEQDYKDWLAGQVFIRKRWESKIKQVSGVLHTHNLQANKIIHENAMDVFRENYNYSAFTAEMGTGVSFDLINEQTVINLAKKNPQLLPEWKIDEEKDYKWNYRKANNAVMQGIIQGESVDKIAKRMAKNLCTQNKNKMRLFARTAITGAQNGGRQAQMEAAEEDGIEQKKEWVATLDGRTRDSHRKLDGQQVGIKESFDGEFSKIMFPGDPTAHPAEVYNCRCAMITVYPKYAGFVGKTPRRAKSEYTDKEGNKRSFSYLTQDPEMYEKWKNGKTSQIRNEYNEFLQNSPFHVSFEEWKEQRRIAKENEKRIKPILKKMEGTILPDDLEDEYRQAIHDSLLAAPDNALKLISRTAGNVKVYWKDKPNSPDEVSHYSYGTGEITMYKRDFFGNKYTLSDIERTFWHEYGHFDDDAAISKSGYGRKTEYGTLNGIHWEVRENNKYEEAAAEDINNFLKNTGLSDRYECRFDEGSYSAWIFKNGSPIDVRNPDMETYVELSEAFDKWANAWCGYEKAENYYKDMGEPEMPRYSDYFERYTTPKRGIEREREKYKGASIDYDVAYKKAAEAQDEFWKTHDRKKLAEEKAKLYEEAEKKRFALAAAADTFDGASSGAFQTIVLWGGHTADYYCQNYNGVKEGVANVHSIFIRGSELEETVMLELCPGIYKLVKGVIDR